MTTARENADFLIRQARAAGITDRRELAIFMGQMQVESGGFRSMHEGLGYRPERLLDVFGPHTDRRGVWHDGRNGLTTLDEARAITARGPQGIAEAIYGGAWGARNLGNTEPGDGWKYHGRGYVQLTGRDNYERIGRALGIDLVNHPDLAAERDVAARIAIHYWQERVRANGNQLDVAKATRDINGGQNHLAERRAAAIEWERKFQRGYLERFGAQGEAAPVHTSPPSAGRQVMPGMLEAGFQGSHGSRIDGDRRLETGERDPAVVALQQRLADPGYRGRDGEPLTVDGDFGANTRHVAQESQRGHGLQTPGIAGPKTGIALDRAEQSLMSYPSHPHHGLYAQLLQKVQAEERARGIEPGHHSQRIAAALAVECLREGITRVDRVELNRDVTLVRGVQVSTVRDEPGLNRSTNAISTRQASQQTLLESSEQIHQVAVNLQAQQRDGQQQRVSPALAS